jgi:hypothetical protein
MRLPRLMHRLYAAMAGYFWLPCPRCGVYFGGHEWRAPDGWVVTRSDSDRRLWCPTCTPTRRFHGVVDVDYIIYKDCP